MCCQLSECCCGCSLQLGTVVAGILSLVGAANVLIFCAVAWQYFSFEEDSLFRRFAIASIAIGTMSFMSTIPLLVSAFKNERRKLLLPWLVFGVLGMMIGCIMTLFTGSLLIIFGIPQMNAIFATHQALIIGALLSVGFGIYLWVVVYSYYRTLERRKLNRRVTSKA